MELSVESPCHYVTWKVHDFFQLPSEIGYSLDSPEIRFAGDSYCLRLYPNGSEENTEGAKVEIFLERLTSTFPDRNVSRKLAYRRIYEGGVLDKYFSSDSLDTYVKILRSAVEEERDMWVPDDTFTVLCSIFLRAQSSGKSPESAEAKTADSKEEREGLPGQSECFSSCWRSSKMELSIESPYQYVAWKVQDFFQLLSKSGYCLISPVFRFADDRYCLRFYPKGDRNGDAADFDLQLVRLTSTFPERIVLYEVGNRGKTTLGKDLDTYHYSGTLIDEFGFCLSRSQLEEKSDDFVRDGTLTVLCSMRLGEQSNAGCPQSEEVGPSDEEDKQEEFPGKDIVTCAVQTEVANTGIENENPKNEELSSLDIKDDALLRERMKKLLTKGSDHDVTICVQDKEFRAHRNILSARSPVFAMMLSHDTKENNTSTISIEDCDPESFDEFLLYVYSGRTENLTPSNALQLYYPADKYDFPVLKERCVSLLKTSLSVESICDVVLLAAKHQEKELLDAATEFFARNMKKILVTVGWQKFMAQNLVVGNELIIKSMEILHPEE